MKFKIAYVIFLIVCLLYPKLLVLGPISLRHILTVVMLVWCVFEKGFKFDKFLKWFCVFLFFSALGAMATGYASAFFGRFFGTYLAAIAMYLSTKVVIKNHNGSRWVLSAILIVAVLNALTAIGQFYGAPIATVLPQLLGIDMSEEMLEFYEKTEDFHGTYVGGLMGIVTSGYFLSGACILALYNKKNAITVFNWLLFAFVFYALFLVQERSGLATAILGTFLYIMVNLVNSKNALLRLVIIFIIAVVVISRFGGGLVNLEEMRYSTMGFTDQGRANLSMNGWHYFIDNLLGGIDAYHAAGNRDPHTIFVNAFLHGGVFGGLVVLIIVFTQLVKVMRILYQSYRKKSHSLLLNAFSIASFCYILNSFFHNASVASGDVMIFLLWGAVTVLLEMEESANDSPIVSEDRQRIVETNTTTECLITTP